MHITYNEEPSGLTNNFASMYIRKTSNHHAEGTQEPKKKTRKKT